MSIKRLRDRAPSACFYAVAVLRGHDLRFHKIGMDGSAKCDAYETGSEEQFVMGTVFEISGADKPGLDDKEGLGYGYEEKMVRLATESGAIIEAYTYYATRIDPLLKPFHWYKHHVLTGAREYGLPEEYIRQIECVESIDDPKPDRHEREMAIYSNVLSRL